MPLIGSYPLTSTFAGVSNLEGRGMNVSGNSIPHGAPGLLEIGETSVVLTVRETDEPTYGDRRTELSFKPQLDPTGERWYTWEFMVPSDWGSTDVGFAIMQIHESPGEKVAVQFTLHLENNQLVARVPVDVTVPGGASYRVGNQPFEFDRWHAMCFHANWQLDKTGFWELFVDRVPMLKRFNFPNCYDREQGGYLKLGIYNFNKASGWGKKSIHIRNVNIWAGNDGYQKVMGGVPITPSQMLQK